MEMVTAPPVNCPPGGRGSSNARETRVVDGIRTRVPIGIVGLGFGRWIVRGLQNPDNQKRFEIAALCDLDAGRLSEIQNETGATAATFDELLENPAIPSVGIFTGPAGRAELIRQAIQAGKDVITTKPFERDSAAARSVLEEARALGRIVHLNSPRPRLSPDLALIQKWRQTYELGIPVTAQLSTYANYREQADGLWQDDPALCPAAPLFRLGIYLINDAIEIFGKPEEVHVMTSRLFTQRPTPDNAHLSIRFRSGSLVSVNASFCVRNGDPYRNELSLHFEGGSIYRNTGPEGNAGSSTRLTLLCEEDGRSRLVEDHRLTEGQGVYDWAFFHRAVLSRALLTPEYIEKVADGIRVVEAIAESEQTGMPVRVSS